MPSPRMFPTKWQEDLEEVAAAEAAKGWVAPGPDTIEGAYTSEHDGSGRLLPIGIRKPVAGRADAPAQDPSLWPQNQTEAAKPSLVADLDPEMTSARDSDRNLRLGADIEKIGRIWSGGDAMVRPADAVSRLMAAREKARKDALETKKASNAEMQLTGFLGGQAERARHDAAMLKIAQDKEAREVEAARVAAELKKEEGKRDDRKLGQGDRHLSVEEKNAETARLKAEAEAAKVAKGHQLPASVIEGLAEMPTALGEIDRLKQAFDRLQMGSTTAKASSALTGALGLQGTDAAEYNAAAKRAMQGVGKILEGGKLAAGDEAKYSAMLPRAGDPPAVVEQKVQGMKNFLRQLVADRMKGLRAGGYDVPEGMIDGGPPSIPAKAQGDQVEIVMSDGRPSRVSKRSAELLIKAGKAKAK